MNSDEFVEYIKLIKQYIGEDLCYVNCYIRMVKAIEKIKDELGVKDDETYLKRFMVPEDYIKIIKELKYYKVRKFNKCIVEKKKYLNKLELSESEYTNILNSYIKKLSKLLDLEININKKGKIYIK